jgi:cytochrome b6-f complex iron-sulfur subunit
MLFGVFALSWGAMTVLPFLRYLTPKAKADGGETVASVNIGPVDGIRPGQGKNFQFGHQPGVILHDADGQFYAYNAVCTHLGCTVQYNSEKANIWCACHGGVYDAKTGKNIAGPPPKPLKPLNVDVVDGQLIVSNPSAPPSAAQKS